MSKEISFELTTNKSFQEKLLNEIIDDVSTTTTTKSTASTKGTSSRTAVTVISTGSMVCRICQTTSIQEPLISPCHCKGSMAYVHLSCLERWLNQSSRIYCELCMYRFNAIQSKRYGLFEGLKLWIKHPRNRSHIQSDLLIGSLLTIITIGLIVVCLLGLEYFIIEARKFGLTKFWTQAVLACFLSVIISGYFVTIYLLVKDQVIPWYTWWKKTVDVRLLLTPSVSKGITRQLSKEAAAAAV